MEGQRRESQGSDGSRLQSRLVEVELLILVLISAAEERAQLVGRVGAPRLPTERLHHDLELPSRGESSERG